MHGGSTPNGRKAAQVDAARAVVEALRLENPPGVTPVEALERELARSAVLVDALRRKLILTLDGGEEALAWGTISRRTDDNAKDGVSITTVEAAQGNVWWQLYREERLHLVKVAQALGGLVPADANLGRDDEVERTAADLLQSGALAKLLPFRAS